MPKNAVNYGGQIPIQGDDFQSATIACTAGMDGIDVVLGNVNSSLATLSNNKQNKTDNGLATTDKTIVGAINEVMGSISQKAPISSPIFTGNPQAPTPTFGDNNTSIATSSFVQEAVGTVINVVGNNGGTPVVIPASKPIGYIYEIRKTGTTGIVNITLADTNEKFTTGLLTQISLNTDGDFWRIKKVSSTRWDIVEGHAYYTNSDSRAMLTSNGIIEYTGVWSSSLASDTNRVISLPYTCKSATNALCSISDSDNNSLVVSLLKAGFSGLNAVRLDWVTNLAIARVINFRLEGRWY